MKRILVAAVVGGLVSFLWSTVTHVVLPIGQAGVKGLPGESGVREALQKGLPEAGMYIFPGDPADDSPDAMAKVMEEYRTGPTGVLVYKPLGGEFSFPRHLSIELLTNILAALIAAAALSRIPGSYLQRVLWVAGFGAFAWLSISASYWNWYGFPSTYVLAEGFDQVGGWFVAGLAIAKLAPREEHG